MAQIGWPLVHQNGPMHSTNKSGPSTLIYHLVSIDSRKANEKISTSTENGPCEDYARSLFKHLETSIGFLTECIMWICHFRARSWFCSLRSCCVGDFLLPQVSWRSHGRKSIDVKKREPGDWSDGWMVRYSSVWFGRNTVYLYMMWFHFVCWQPVTFRMMDTWNEFMLVLCAMKLNFHSLWTNSPPGCLTARNLKARNAYTLRCCDPLDARLSCRLDAQVTVTTDQLEGFVRATAGGDILR